MCSGNESILNPHPIQLAGPSLLHHLIGSASSLPALEYLSRGCRTAYTFQELHDAADIIARHVAVAAASFSRSQQDFIVPVLIPQSPLLYISLLGILKAGGAFCPLDLDAPPERVKFILGDVSSVVVLVSSDTAHKLPVEPSVTVVKVDEVIDNHDYEALELHQPSPNDLAYVMYTSGSTGIPKAVAISHAAATQALLAHDAHIPPFSRFLQFAAPTFDVSVFEIFFPLFRGATLIAARRDEMLDDLPGVLRRMEVDACELTPTVAASLLRTRRSAPKLKLLLTIGEMLSSPVIREFGGSSTRPAILWAMYGPTEATIHCTMQMAFSSDFATSVIGLPLETVSCFILEPDCLDKGSGQGNCGFQVLPRGKKGELAIGGYQLARGYLNRPDQTTAVFVDSPYGRLYRTGDRARMTKDGKLEFLGRLADGQVKLRGQRIELGEVEHAILTTPGCFGAVATVVQSTLVAFCAADQGVTEDNVMSRCRDWLPKFMVPGQVVMLDSFPHLSSGKVDIRKMKASYEQCKELIVTREGSVSEGLTKTDEEILHLVSQILGCKVNSRTSLSSAGVDSLSAIRLSSAFRDLGKHMTAPELLKLGSMSDILDRIRESSSTICAKEHVEISLKHHLADFLAQNTHLGVDGRNIEDLLPCTPLQSAMLAETLRDARLYSNVVRLRLDENLSPNDVADAICLLCKSNEILRTGFAEWRGKFIAIVYKTYDTAASLALVTDFRPELLFEGSQDLLTPLRFQIREERDGMALQILIQVHHAVYDGWSLDLIIKDLSLALSQKPIPPRPQFRQALQYHASGSKKAADDLARQYWAEAFLGWKKPPFPKLTARVPTSGSKIQTIRQTLDVLPSQLYKAKSQTGFSPQIFFQASLVLLWSGVTGSEDVVHGVVSSGRTMPVSGIENIIGPCIASLPVRTNLDSMTSYGDILRSVSAGNRDIMEHCGLSLADVKRIAELQPTDSLYDVLFVYQESLETWMGSKYGFTKKVVELEHRDTLETKVLIEIQPDSDRYTLQATYHSSWLAPGLIEAFLHQFESILKRVLQNPEAPIHHNSHASIPGSSIHDAKQSFDGVPDLAVHFQVTAARRPEAIALRFGRLRESRFVETTAMSYRELNESANQVAHYLESHQAVIGEVVAIIMEKSPAFYIYVLGVIKAGCAYLPILPSTPEERVRKILNQARIHHCLVDNSHPASLSYEHVSFLSINLDLLKSYSKENRDIPADPSRLAYVIYTSGTTGDPKGVAITQLNIVSNIAFLASLYPAPRNPDPRLLQACSQAFDVSVFEIFYTWSVGMCLCAAAFDDAFSDLEACISQMAITHLSLTPTVASLIHPAEVPEVEFLVTAGEPMTLGVLDRWGDRLWQGYGPSETTNICSVKRMERGNNIEHLGWTLPNTSVCVTRPGSLETLPMGWVGELCFGGDQVGMGYLNDAHLTSDRFLKHAEFGEVYRSGDAGRMLPDGSLVIQGRLDDQLKLRGQRIEAGEVNSIITNTPRAVAAVTLCAQRRCQSLDQLVSFYVPPCIATCRAGRDFAPLEIDPGATQEVFADLSANVPSYMVPSYLIPVTQIPTGTGGKVDRRRLVACFQDLQQERLEAAASATSSDDGGEWSRKEMMIAESLANSTHTPRADLGRWTPFPAIGVDSISAIGVCRLLNRDLGISVPISVLLQNPTIAQLAKYVKTIEDDRRYTNGRGSSIFGATFADDVMASLDDHLRVQTEDIYPCTPLQEAMLSTGNRSYYNKLLFRLKIQPNEIKEYWRVVEQRHAILRSCFVTTTRVDYSISQVVLGKWRATWKSFCDDADSSLAVIQEKHLAYLPPPLDSGEPPISCALIEQDDAMFFSLICHHAIYDGVAMENLQEEIEALARGRMLPPPTAFKPFIEQILRVPEDAGEFWSKQFLGLKPSLLFPKRSFNIKTQRFQSRRLKLALSDARRKIMSLGVSLLAVCQAAWAHCLSIASGSLNVTFGNVCSGRNIDIEGVERLVAPCFNTIPIRADLSTVRCPRNIDFLRHLQHLNTQVLPYQFTPLRQIQRSGHGPSQALFDTLLLLQQPQKGLDDGVWALEDDSGNMDIPLVCEILPCLTLDMISVKLHCKSEVVTAETSHAILETFDCVLGHVVNFPSASLNSQEVIPKDLKMKLETLTPRAEAEESDPGEMVEEIWSDSERAMRHVLSELSQVPEETITRHTTIFRLGLDSINAVQVASMLRKRGFEVSSSDVLQFPCCASLAPYLGRALKGDHGKMLCASNFSSFKDDVQKLLSPEVAASAEAILPATPMQSAMLAAFIQSRGQNYLNTLTFQLDDDVNINEILRAWDILHQRHPMLRTGFGSTDSADQPFAMIRYAKNGDQDPMDYLDRQSATSFDLKVWQDECRKTFLANLHIPPWRMTVRGHRDGTFMYLIIHHALYDASSMREMLAGLSRLIHGGLEPIFESIEPALNEIISRGQRHKAEAQSFWSGLASKAVVNKFPIMTSLKEQDTGLVSLEVLSSMLSEDLREATRRQDISIQATVQAAWARVLSSYIGESTVVFGTILSGRDTDVTLKAPLPCISTIPVIATNQTSNRKVIDDMMSFNAELHKHQFAPLSQIQSWLGHPASPVFDTLVVFQRNEHLEQKRPPWRLVKDTPALEYLVCLEVEPVQAERVRLSITFANHILPEEQADLLIQQFDATLQHLVCEPSGDERDLCQRRPDLYSNTPAISPSLPSPVKLLHQFVELRSATDPDTTALEFVRELGDSPQKWTYRELDVLGNKVANLLRDTTNIGDLVAIHFPKCPEAYFSILGVLKSGCSFLALDPEAPAARNEFILRDSQARCILTDCEDSLGLNISSVALQISMDSLKNLSDRPPNFGENGILPGNTCYCLYTSGTTGTPKGCEISHENTVQAMMAFQELFKGHWCCDSRWLQFAALQFDVSVLEQYWSWSVGITLVAAPKDTILSDLSGTVNRLKITHIDLTPSLAALTDPDEMPTLCNGVFITGGEQLKQEILDKWGARAVIYNAYGPTEATIGVTMYQRVPVNGRPSNIGKQFPNVGTYVLHPGTDTPVLRGGVGELCVSGALVGKGYLNRPQLTEDRFPILNGFGERVYRTGDLVRILSDNCIDMLGRADDQVKLRGQRLEIGEINHAIRDGVPEIRSVATILASRESSCKEVLVSFLTDGEQLKDSDHQTELLEANGVDCKARAACQERLPAYMVPSFFLRVTRIPLSSNNKSDGNCLRALFQRISDSHLMSLSATTTVSPTSAVNEAVLKEIFPIISSFTGVSADSIGLSTSILDLGVDSVNIVRLCTLLRSAGFESASSAVLLRRPIIADVVRAISAATKESRHDGWVTDARWAVQACHHRHNALACRELEIEPREIEYIAPCSPLQHGMILRSMESAASGAYFCSFKLRLARDACVEKVRASWSSLVENHAILRSAFISTPDGYIQVALKGAKSRWSEIKVVTEEEAVENVDMKRTAWIGDNTPNIVRPLEFVYANGADFHIIYVHIFHALYDGISWGLMERYASALYHDMAPPSGPPLVEALVHGPLQRHDHCRRFWDEHLHGWTPSVLPTLPETSRNQSTVSASRTLKLEKIEALRSKLNVTLQAAALAMWAVVLRKRLGGNTTLGVVVAGRSIELTGIELTIGPLFNTVPFFARASGEATWSSLIREAHAFGSSTLDLQHTPLSSIQKWCSDGRSLFDNLFVFQIEQPRPADDDIPWIVEDGPSHADYPLALEMTRMLGGDFKVTLVAQGQYFTTSMLEDLLDRLDHEASTADSEGIVDIVPKGDTGTEEKSNAQECNLSSESTPLTESFEWTGVAAMVRDELAALAGIRADGITAETTLLQLGLDSIDTMRLSARLKNHGYILSVSSISRAQRIPLMVKQLELNGHVTPQPAPAPDALLDLKCKLVAHVQKAGVDMDTVESVLPPTALQEAMMAGIMQSDFQWYFNHDILEVAEGVDMERLTRAWERVVDASPVLRTGFVEIDDPELDMAYCQVVFRRAEPHTSKVPMLSFPKPDLVMAEATKLAREGKGLKNLAQFTPISVGGKKQIVLSVAHALYDGWSLGLMHRDLEAAYRGSLETRPSAVPFLSNLLATDVTDARAFWASHLSGFCPTCLASELPLKLEADSSVGVRRRQCVSNKSLSKVLDFCKNNLVSLQTLCAAAWAMVVAAKVGALDVVFGLVLSGRDGVEEVMFPTMNTVALRCVLHGSVTDFLQYLQACMADVSSFQAFPLRKALAAAKSTSPRPFDSLLLLQRPLESEESAGKLFRSIGGEAAVEYPVCIEAEPAGSNLTWRIACSGQHFSEKETESLIHLVDEALCFLITGVKKDLLAFREKKVSIGPLPAVTIKDTAYNTGSEAAMLVLSDGDDDDWDKTAIAVRDALSHIARIPTEVVSLQSSLYQLGLDSIDAIKVSMALRRKGFEISPGALVRSTSLAEIARTAVRSEAAMAPAPVTQDCWVLPAHSDIGRQLEEWDLPTESVEVVLPATPMQVYMLTAWQNSAGRLFYPEFCYDIAGGTSEAEIFEAWSCLVDETPILRTRFVATGAKDVPWLQIVISRQAVRSGQNSQPLVQLVVNQHAPGSGLQLLLGIHHALYDGFSLPALVSRLGELLNGVVGHCKDAGFSQWKQYCITPCGEEARRNRRAFWTAYLQGCGTTQSQVSCADVTERIFYLDSSAVSDAGLLQAAASKIGVSLQALFLAGLAMGLRKTIADSGRAWIVLGLYLANRGDGVGPLLAVHPTLNIVPLKVQFRDDGDMMLLAKTIQDDIHKISCDGRAETGLWEIANWTGVQVDHFVNFLADTAGTTKDDCKDTEDVVKLTREKDPSHNGASGAQDRWAALRCEPWMQKNAVRDVFPPSVDIEVSVQGVGLAMGVFGPRARVTERWAAELVADTSALLTERCMT